MDLQHYDQFIRCQPKLYRFALSLVKDVEDAEDIYQETLMKLWELRAAWAEWRNFEAYAMRTMHNVFLNYIKKNKKQVHVGLDTVTEHAASNEIENNIVLTDLRMRFISLISKLPEVQRNILFLREIEQMEYKEISEVLCITEAQVKVYLFRGRQYLKSKTNGKR